MRQVTGSLDRHYPSGSFFCARTTREVMRWNVPDVDRLPTYRLDATPAQLAGFAGTLPFVAHEAAATPLALDFMAHCGLPGASNLYAYRTSHEAADIALGLMNNGMKLAYNFGTLPELDSHPEQHLIPPALYGSLNAKQSLADLAGEDYLAPRITLPAECTTLPPGTHIRPPVYIKLASGSSTGGGAGVYHCSDEATLAETLNRLAPRLSSQNTLVIEADCEAVASWCAGVVILDDGVGWLGASCQVFRAPAQQVANETGARVVPDSVRRLSLDIADRARAKGFRGIAGFDIGECKDGSIVAFDLNFRPNSSSGLLLAYEAVRERTGLPLMRSFYLRHDGPLSELLDTVEADAAAGRIVPGSVFDACTYRATVDEPATRSCLDGWVAAETSEQAVAWVKGIQNRLAS